MTTQTFPEETVTLMRGPLTKLADSSEHRLRLALRLVSGMDRIVQQIRQDMDLNSNEMAALLTVWDGGRCNMTQLGNRIGLSRAAITTLVDRLEAKQLLTRAPHPDDRRKNVLFVSPSFEEDLLARLAAFDSRLQAAPISDEQWSGFGEVAARLRDEAIRNADEMHLARRAAPKRERDEFESRPSLRQFW